MLITLWLALAQAADPGTPRDPAPVAEPATDVSAAPAEAQASAEVPAPDLTQTPTLTASAASPSRALRQAHGMKVAGIVLTGVGITTGTLATGLAVWGGAMTGTCEFECMGPVFAFSGAVIGAGITGAFLGAGLPLWVVGRNSEHRLSAPLQTLIVVPTANPHGGGVAMAFQF
jgi:hypothetical protein